MLETKMPKSLPQLPVHNPAPLWFWISSMILMLVAVCLFVVSVSSGIYRSRLSALLIPTLLLCLGFAAFLHIQFLWQARKGQREADSAFYAIDCEFNSVFRHALDGILILDDRGTCLDANPAAFAILGVARDELIGQRMAKFHVDREEYARNWNSFLEQKYQRGSAQLMRGDESSVFVDYAAVANYVPGRHVAILCDTTERRHAELSLRQSEERFQQMANHIQEIFWMMDAQTKNIVYVNKAYEAVTGRTVSALYRNPFSYQDDIHPEDRLRVLARLDDGVATGRFDEEFRIVRADGAVRWLWVKASPVRDAGQVTRWLVGTGQDITSRKWAELQIAKHLAAAEGARAEAEALRKSTLALTQNLAMDTVLDTLLECIGALVPYDSASVLLAEGAMRLLVAREAPQTARKSILTFEATENPVLLKVLLTHKGLLIPDTTDQPNWAETKMVAGIHSWIVVPLAASGKILGLLSIGSSKPKAFTPEHLRLAKSLAIPAAAAIQNARLYERSEIYASELEFRIAELKQTQKALEQSESRACGRESD
ncbi:MAG TPA: PAS domain S-box protein [Candidatus Dormibacteraeota bacterium]|nr:PAS domain S-box protein [Candidatus Dormibacteraeota bacterium]